MKNIKVMTPKELKKAREEAIPELFKAREVADIAIKTLMADELSKAKKGKSKYLNPDNTFKGGFDGCVRYQKEVKGLSEESAKKLCAYIGRRAGKIK